jgi:hypothetical protein
MMLENIVLEDRSSLELIYAKSILSEQRFPPTAETGY